MIIRELLSEVLGLSNPKHIMYYNDDKELHYVDKNQGGTINIYELAHRCKEKAFEWGFGIAIDYNSIEIYSMENGRPLEIWRGLDNAHKPEYTFKACQWMLENKDK